MNVIEANGAQHPPNARSPLDAPAGIEDGARALADPHRREAGGQICGRRHHEVGRIGNCNGSITVSSNMRLSPGLVSPPVSTSFFPICKTKMPPLRS